MSTFIQVIIKETRINKTVVQKPEALEIKFLRLFFRLTKLDRQRNPDIRNRLKVNNLIEDIELYQKSWSDHLERMERSRLHRLAFRYRPWERRDIGRPRNRWKHQEALSFKGIGLKN